MIKMDEGIACIGGKIMISEAVIKRLPRYYRHIKHLADSGVTRVSSNKSQAYSISQRHRCGRTFAISADSVSRATDMTSSN